MKAFFDFQATRRPCADLRFVPDSPYSPLQNDEGAYPEPVAGFVYANALTIEGPFPADGGFRTFIQFEEDSADLLSLEIDLFYWHARERANLPPLTFFDVCELASMQSDLNRALRYVQDALGVESGDNAALHFSWTDESGGPSETSWKAARWGDRARMLADYVRSELTTVDWRHDARLDRYGEGKATPDDARALIAQELSAEKPCGETLEHLESIIAAGRDIR